MDVLNRVIGVYRQFNGQGMYMALFFVSLIYIYMRKKEQNQIHKFVFPSVLVGIVVFFPLTAKIIMDYMIGEIVYFRMFWLFPIFICIAYVITRVVSKIKIPVKKITAVIIFILVIMLSGKNIYLNGSYQEAENIYKIPNETIFVMDKLPHGASVILPNELIPSARQYRGDIITLYGRDALLRGSATSEYQELFVAMSQSSADMQVILKNALAFDIEYIVLKKDIEYVNGYSRRIVKIVDSTPEYNIFQIKDASN